jgi:hypothetical protein
MKKLIWTAETFPQNPKLVESPIIDCVPQAGRCPMNCDQCYFNFGFYAPTPLFPPVEITEGKIVRVNSGHDSNIDRNYVIESTNCYKDRYFNTSMPQFDFPGPVVFTCNGRDTDKTFYGEMNVSNLMCVNIRANLWNIELVAKAAAHYTEFGVPVNLVWMRYYEKEKVLKPKGYIFKKHFLNSYWSSTLEAKEKILKLVKDKLRASGEGKADLVCACGSGMGDLENHYCGNCLQCVGWYRAAIEKGGKANG